MSREDAQRQDSLRDDAGRTRAYLSDVGFNGSRRGGLRLGGIGGDGEERGEEIHCCVCGAWVERCYETL
jgi:hypothetical protein